jgi:antitoxin CcdA
MSQQLGSFKMSIAHQEAQGSYRSVDLSINNALLLEAEKLRIDIVMAVEQGLKHALRERKEALWIESNRDAIESSCRFVEQYGLPLARYRGF